MRSNVNTISVAGINYPTCTFIDIETVRGQNRFSDLSDRMKSLFISRYQRRILEWYDSRRVGGSIDEAKSVMEEQIYAETLYGELAGFSSEFGKIVCVSVGKLHVKAGADPTFYIHSMSGDNESEILVALGMKLEKSGTTMLCAFNGLEFDFPFLERRYMIHSLHVPSVLNTAGKKQWDYNYIDPMKIWSGSAWNYKVSLDLLCELLKVPSPKTELSGDKIGDLYYSPDVLPFDREEQVFNPIMKYCGNGDIFSTANLYCKMMELPEIKETQVVTTTQVFVKK
jgi:DNA polymerase elongation subunit (family B)